MLVTARSILRIKGNDEDFEDSSRFRKLKSNTGHPGALLVVVPVISLTSNEVNSGSES